MTLAFTTTRGTGRIFSMNKPDQEQSDELPIERDLYWKPKMLKEIAPELFEAVPNKAARP